MIERGSECLNRRGRGGVSGHAIRRRVEGDLYSLKMLLAASKALKKTYHGPRTDRIKCEARDLFILRS